MSDSSDSGDDQGPRLKSAYEAALERLDSAGISRPDTEALSDSARESIAEARRKAEAELAQMEIMHREELAAIADPIERARLKEHYLTDRRRIEATLETRLDKLRRDS